MYNPLTKMFSGNVQAIDYTPASAVSAGQVIIINGIAYIAPADIPANQLGCLIFAGGVWGGSKATGAWTAGSPVYYDSAATPNVTANNTGAYTQAPSPTAIFVGYAVLTPGTTIAAASADQYGYFVKSVAAGTGTGAGATTVAATGTNQATGALLSTGLNFVTGANATKTVVLPPNATAGQTVEVKNSDAANAVLPVYANTALGTINAIAAGSAISMAAKTACTFKCMGNDVWITIPLVPS